MRSSLILICLPTEQWRLHKVSLFSEDRHIKKIFSKGSFLGLRCILLAILSCVFLLSDYNKHLLAPVRTILSYALSPIQYVARLPDDVISWVELGVTTKKNLINENAELHAKQLTLEAEVQKLAFLEQENAELHALLGSAEKTKDKILSARLLTQDFNGLNKQVVINRGKHDGVFVGQPLLDAGGLMGQIISVDSTASKALLITDTQSAIPVTNIRTGARSIAVGVGEPDSLELAYTPDTSDVKVGDLLVTSNLGLRLPEGYPVGIVKVIKHVSGERFAKVIITPNARVDRSRYVLLVWPGQPKVNKEAKQVVKSSPKQKTKSKSKVTKSSTT